MDRLLIKVDTLREVIIETLIERLGEILHIDTMTTFQSTVPDPRIFFLGLNNQTKKLHWMAFNAEYQERFTHILSTQIQELYSPDNPLEVPKDPPKKNNIEKGLTMLSFKYGQVLYSSDARADPRSLAPEQFDKPLGIHSSLYIPIIVGSEPLGVILVTFTNGTIGEDLQEETKQSLDEFRSNGALYDQKIRAEKKAEVFKQLENVEVEVQSTETEFLKHFDEIPQKRLVRDLAIGQIFDLKVKDCISDPSEPLKRYNELLGELFRMHIGNYNDLIGNFDMYVINAHRDGLCTKPVIEKIIAEEAIASLIKLEMSPSQFIDACFQNKNLPSAEFLENLEKLEPFLIEIGKRKHYRHMFHVYTLGNVILDRLDVDKYNVACLWLLVSTFHDIGYNIEQSEDVIRNFLKKYFHKQYCPEVLLSKELYFGYGNFPKFKRWIIDNVSAVLEHETLNKKAIAEIIEDMLVYRLLEASDHAVISAFLAMDSLKRRTLEEFKVNLGLEKTLQIIGSTILMHNFHKWREHFTGSSVDRLKTYFQTKALDDEAVDNYKNNVAGLTLGSPLDLTSTRGVRTLTKALTFLLQLCDTLQEWDRDIQLEGIRILNIHKIAWEGDKLYIACRASLLKAPSEEKPLYSNAEDAGKDNIYYENGIPHYLFNQAPLVTVKRGDDLRSKLEDKFKKERKKFSESRNTTRAEEAVRCALALKIIEVESLAEVYLNCNVAIKFLNAFNAYCGQYKPKIVEL